MTESPDYAYDVFITYAEADKAWVLKELLPRVEKAGRKVCIFPRDQQIGASKIEDRERAITTSERTLMVLTEAFFKDAWSTFTGGVSQTLDVAAQAKRVIPLLKEKCTVPPRIDYLTPADFTDPEELATAWRQLLTALGAPPPQEAPQVETPRSWYLAHPYPMPPNFTGREAERKLLTDWLERDAAHPLMVIRALGGFGKSALTWHWLTHDVDGGRWPNVVWWSFYETDSGFESFLAKSLKYLGVDARGAGLREQLDVLLTLLYNNPVLVVLDGFERELRAFSSLGAAYQGDGETAGQRDGASERDCVSPLAETLLRAICARPDLHSKVLMTTRLRPRPVEQRGGILLIGCAEQELTQLQPEDAAAFFRAQGIRGSRAELETAGNPYGYHPLSLRLLAGLILTDLQQPGDIAAAQHLDVGEDLVQRQHHVLQVAYDRLSPQSKKLLGVIACFRSPVALDALDALVKPVMPTKPVKQGFVARLFAQKPKALFAPKTNIADDLRDLIDRGWLHHNLKANRYDLHPIVRRYAYDRLNSNERTAAHSQLRNYFENVPKLGKVQRLEDLTPMIELYHHTVRAGQYDAAQSLFKDRIDTPTYYQFGAYQLQIDLLRALFPDGEDHLPHLTSESAQASTLNDLAAVYSLSGQPRRAVVAGERQIAIREKQGDKKNLAVGLVNVAVRQLVIGELRAAEANLRRSIALCVELGDEFREAVGHQELGRVLACRGEWAESQAEFQKSLAITEKIKHVQNQGLTWAYRALRAVLMLRANPSPAAAQHPLPTLGEGNGSPSPRTEERGAGGEAAGPTALSAATRALELADEDARTTYPVERDYVRAHWLLGAAHRVNGHLTEADSHLNEALTRCRKINNVEHEADILIDLARLRLEQGERDEARRLANEALTITERCEYVLQGADANLVLARLAQLDGDKRAAQAYARAAQRLATCDGVSADGNYTYKVAYDEAEAMLSDE